jgi:hypothetical protein
MNRYNAPGSEVPLRFITEELGFESDNESIEFLGKVIPDYGLFLKTKPVTEPGFPEARQIPFFLCNSKEVKERLEAARGAAFKKIDIKGQI